MANVRANYINSLQIFQLLRYAAVILISVLFAKSYLPTLQIGIYESFVFYFSIFTFFWLTGLVQGILSLSKSSGEENNLWNVVLNGLILNLTFSLFAAFISLFVISNTLNSELYNINFLFPIYLIISPAGWLIEYIILLDKKFNKLIQYGVLNFVFQIVFVGLVPIFGLPFVWIFYGLMVVSILKLVLLVIILLNKVSKGFSYHISTQILRTSLPLMGTALLTSSAVFIDGLLINLNFDERQFAIFRYGAKEFPIFLIIASSFSNSLLTRFTTHNEVKPLLKEIKVSSGKMINFLFPLSIILLISSHYIFPKVFNSEFKESAAIFDIYLLLVVSRFIFPQTILIGLKKTNLVLRAGLIEFVVNIISSLLLIQYFGIIGVAFGTILAFYSEKMVLIYYAKKQLSIDLNQYANINLLGLYSIILWIIYILKYQCI